MKKITIIIILYPNLNKRLLQLIAENNETIKELELNNPPKIEKIDQIVKGTAVYSKISYQKRQKLEQRRFKKKK